MTVRDYGEFEHISFDRRVDGVVVVTLDRPDVLNAANVRMHHEMAEVWAVVDADTDARVAVVTGAGRAFSAGGDLEMIDEMTTDYDALLAQWHDAAPWWRRCSMRRSRSSRPSTVWPWGRGWPSLCSPT